VPNLAPRKPRPELETDVLKEIRTYLAAEGITHWRNNTGALRDVTNRLVVYGLCEGSADLIAIVPVNIILPPALGGHATVGRFVAIEVKRKGANATAEQLRFLDTVAKAGGVAGVARSVADAKAIIERARRW